MRRYYPFHVLMGAFVFVVVSLMVDFTSGSAASVALKRYPYLTDVVGPYATINWATDRSDSAGAVRFGKAGAEPCTARYAPATKTSILVNGVFQYQWKAMLELEPGTQYCYRVYLGTSPVREIDLLEGEASPSFWTQVPAGSTESFSFAVFGDWGYVDGSGSNVYQARVMSLIASSGARFAVTTGDNGYPAGNQANYGDLVQTGANISAVFGPAFWKVPGSSISLFPTIGNHGFNNPDVNHPHIINWPQDRAVSMSDGRYVKETYCCVNGSNSAAYPSAWYAFDAGPARFYVLEAAWSETNVGSASEYQMDYDTHWAPGTRQYEWLKADLAAHPSVLKFAFFHYPLYSDNPQEGTDAFLLGNDSLEGLLKENGVDIAFTGHAHIYERNLAGPQGIPNYITGGGGATPGTLGACTSLDAYAIKFTDSGAACGSAPVPTSEAQIYHFLKVMVNGTNVTVTPINSLGQIFDVMDYAFSDGAEAVAPTPPSNLAASATSGTQINLRWSASSDNKKVAGYSIYRDGTLIDTVASNTLRYSDTDLIPATTYSYTVDAYDGSSNHSTASEPALATTDRTATYTFTPVADAYVAGDTPTTNFGLTDTLKADASTNSQSYLRFHVGDVHGQITRATLRLYVTSGSDSGYEIRQVSSQSWEEGSLTFVDAPAVGEVIDSLRGSASGGWTTVDVTELVNDNGVYDFALTTTGSILEVNSRDANSRQPELVIETASVPQQADLSLEKSISDSTPNVNASITFTLSVTNQGPEAATGVEITDQLPSGYTYISSTPSQGTYNGLNGTWTVGSLAVNASATLQITAQVNISGSYTNVAEISASQLIDPDSTPGNDDPNEDDRDTVTIRVRRGRDAGSGVAASNQLLSGFLIPVTGYAPNVQTELSEESRKVFDTTSLSIKIPALSVHSSIVAVPYQDNRWDVSWLWQDVGWLQGTAFPTFAGNSVITGHFVTADGKPGPFYNLRELKPGDSILVNTGGFTYVYKVVSSKFVKPDDESILDHHEKPWLTLITCDSYDQKSGSYLRRLVVSATLTSIVQSE